MKQCRNCGNIVDDLADVCTSCGYNFRTDTVDPSFVSKKTPAGKENIKEQKSTGVSSGIKKFAFVGLAVLIFSVLYKYNFNVNELYSNAGLLFNRIKAAKSTQGKADKNKKAQVQKVELINVRSFIKPQKEISRKELKIEGISFDPKGRSVIIINGTVIPEGEQFNNIEVKKVNSETVELLVAGKPQTLRVNQRIVFPDK